MDIAPEENKVTPPLREQITRFCDGTVEETEAVPPGRFFRGANRVWRQRYRVGPEFALFEGHFPGHPVLPALGHVLLARSGAERLEGRELAVAGIAQAKFLALVEPGALLELFMAPSRERDGVWLFQTFNLTGDGAVEAVRIKMTLRRQKDGCGGGETLFS